MEYFTHFDNWEEFTNECQNKRERTNNNSRDNDKYFSGTKSYTETMRFAKYGWPEGLNKVKQIIADAAPTMGRVPDLAYGVAGFMPNVALFCAGDPEHMLMKGETFAAGARVITIKVNGCFHAGIDQRTIVNRGVAIQGIVDYLESNDVRCEILYVSANGSNDGTQFNYEVVIKRADEPLDRDKVIFALANPSVHRRMFFHLIETHVEPLVSRWANEAAYGTPSDWPKNRREDAVYLPSANTGNFSTLDNAIQTILPQFAGVLTEAQLDQIREEI